MPSRTPELLLMMTSNELKLTIGYSTLAQRAGNINFPESKKDRQLLVVVQNPNQDKFAISNNDIDLVELNNRGVAKSRNAALSNAKGKYLVFGDDDIKFLESGLDQLVDYFEQHPDCAIIMAQAVDETGTLRKSYPNKAHSLSRFNSAKAATYEIMIRVDAIRGKEVRFDENFGAGVENYLGDEYIFICDALKAGLTGIFLPIPIAVHPKESSGSGWGTKRDLTARAAVFSRVFGPMAPIIRALFLIKSRKGRVGFVNAVRFIIGR